jgi:WD40 repeat protein
MFINGNDLNMGIKEDGVKVNNVETPCNNNPYEFTFLMRYILENDTISYTIQNWIDLIFGCKNKGKEAELANNLYTESSYQEDVDLKKVDNIIIFLRYAEFGLVPNQLMSKGCERKKKKEEILKGKEITNPESKFTKNECQNLKADNPSYEIKNNSNALMVRAFNQGKISILLNDFVFFEKKISQPKFDKIYNEEIINYINLNDGIKHTTINNMSMFYSENSSNNKCIQFFNRGKMLIMGGFYDGKLMIFPIENKKCIEELYPFNEEKPILSVEIDKEENYLFLGNSVGNIWIYQIEIDIKQWKRIHFKTDQISPISHIYCNNEMNLWTSATIDGYINLYSLPLCKLIRCIKVNTKKCSYSFISSSPLPSIIVIDDDENNSQIHAYTINGNFLFKQQEYVHMVNPVLIRDIYSFEYLAFIGKDNIIIKKLPYLDTQVNIDCLPGVHSFCITEDNKALFTIDKNGKKIVLIKD